MSSSKPLLSIITVTHQSYEALLTLSDYLEKSLCTDIRWIIKDSCKCPKTREWGFSLSNPYITFTAKADSGIYNAINQALTLNNSLYYIVLGADDYLYHDALSKLTQILRLQDPYTSEVFVFPVKTEKCIIKPMPWFPIAVSIRALVSSHSAGTVFPSSIHEKFGLYSESYVILSDSLFIKQLYIAGVRFNYYDDCILGYFSTEGISSSYHSLRILEAYNYNIVTGSPVLLQVAILCLRLLKYRVGYLSR